MLKRTGYLAAAAVISICALFAFRGPQGIPALLEKREQIRMMREQNADLQRGNELRRQRIHELKNDKAVQDEEIRKRLKVMKPGEVSIMVGGDESK